jgi:3-oxoacyl-[acyl-carrier-protein] synthase II
MDPKTAVVIGCDAVSPLGIDLEAQWQDALDGKSGIGPLTRFETPPDFPVPIAGQVADIDHLNYAFLKPREQARWISPLFKYALLTVQRALVQSTLIINDRLAPRVAVTYGSAIGGLDAVLGADREMISKGKLPLPCVNPNSCINMVAGKVSILTGATGPITTTITACATGSTSMTVGAMLLAQDRADVVICGAVDFALTAPILAGFSTMNGAYTPREDAPPEDPRRISRPFSANRRGFVVSEGAGCIILASKDFAKTNGLRYHHEIAGWSMTSDAHHFVAPHQPTVTRCIAESIGHAGLQPEDIDAVNAHAASTRIGDQVEYDALKAVFGDHLPPVTANKSLMGHAMGASSAVESIFALLGMREGLLPPTINYQADPKIPIDCVAQGSRKVNQTHVLKNAFGFGGCNTCIVFRRVD